MLIRLCGHFIDNPSHIDKLICIKGLPDDWFFRETKHGKELIRPWTPDVEENIPKSIRHLCDPIEIAQVFPPIEKGRDSVVDHRTIIGVRFDYISEAGQTMWDKIEQYLERSVPRDVQVPKPVLVAPNQKADFDPHSARRSARGSLELRKSDVPVIDLTTYMERTEFVPKTIEAPQSVVITKVMDTPPPMAAVVEAPKQAGAQIPGVAAANPIETNWVKCEPCNKTFNERGLRMHNMKRHPELSPAGV